jgi:hypothetical protein
VIELNMTAPKIKNRFLILLTFVFVHCLHQLTNYYNA